MPIFVQIHPLPGQQLPQSFESLAEMLGNIPGMFFELDGSFVWVDHEDTPSSQMDGMVYDRLGKLAYIEVKGACNARQWLTLCRAVCGLAGPPPLALKNGEAESGYDASGYDASGYDASGYDAIERVARVHRVVEGDWTTASEIASQLPLHRQSLNSSSTLSRLPRPS